MEKFYFEKKSMTFFFEKIFMKKNIVTKNFNKQYFEKIKKKFRFFCKKKVDKKPKSQRKLSDFQIFC